MTDVLADLPVLDRKTLATLERELSPAAVRNFLRLFISDATTRLETIKTEASFDRMDGVACLAHDLVSTAGNIGAIQMSCTARALSRACRNEDRPLAERYLNKLATATYATCLDVQKLLNGEDESEPRAAVERRQKERRKTKVPR